MAKRIIVGEDDPILRKKSREVTVFDKKLHTLLDDMAETMHDAMGVGLAAVQVSMLRRAVVVDVDDEEGLVELINPEIIERSEDTLSEAEGCLSFPGQFGMVERPREVTVRAQDRNGNLFTVTGEGLKARAFCHEIDHLNGVVFRDLATEMLDPEDDE